MRTVRKDDFSPLFLAGLLAGVGLALFVVSIFSQVEGLGFSARPQITMALGLLILISGWIWNLRIRGKNGGAN